MAERLPIICTHKAKRREQRKHQMAHILLIVQGGQVNHAREHLIGRVLEDGRRDVVHLLRDLDVGHLIPVEDPAITRSDDLDRCVGRAQRSRKTQWTEV